MSKDLYAEVETVFFFFSFFRTEDLARKIIQNRWITGAIWKIRVSIPVQQLRLSALSFSRMDSTHHSFWTATNQNTISPHLISAKNNVYNYSSRRRVINFFVSSLIANIIVLISFKILYKSLNSNRNYKSCNLLRDIKI